LNSQLDTLYSQVGALLKTADNIAEMALYANKALLEEMANRLIEEEALEVCLLCFYVIYCVLKEGVLKYGNVWRVHGYKRICTANPPRTGYGAFALRTAMLYNKPLIYNALHCSTLQYTALQCFTPTFALQSRFVNEIGCIADQLMCKRRTNI
jgi:hypothetical protein